MTAVPDDAGLYEVVKRYKASGAARFHMPGHKGIMRMGGRPVSAHGEGPYEMPLDHIAPYDVTELSCTDDLGAPGGALLELERRYARAYGAKASLLLVNGSTSGNLAMLLSLGHAKRVLLARNCHKSVLSGVALAGHDVISIFPDKNTGILTPGQVSAALEINPAEAVFITSPTYYGVCCDVRGIAEAAHAHGALLFVDCAHGAHFPFSNQLPPVPSEADAWVVSCHKTLAALTQTAVLHIGHSSPVSADEMRRMLAMVQSSSPSFPLMLSLESALCEAERGLCGGRYDGDYNTHDAENATKVSKNAFCKCGKASDMYTIESEPIWNWDTHCERIRRIREKISAMRGIRLLDFSDTLGMTGGQDITRLVIGANGLTGYELGRSLESRGIFPEMCDTMNAVLITTPHDPDEWYARLLCALNEIASSVEPDCDTVFDTVGCSNRCENAFARPYACDVGVPNEESFDGGALGGSMLSCDGHTFHPVAVLSVREAMLGEMVLLPPDEAVGRIAAQAVGVYPPGIALLFPGERIKRTAVDELLRCTGQGAKLFGAVEGLFPVVKEG